MPVSYSEDSSGPMTRRNEPTEDTFWIIGWGELDYQDYEVMTKAKLQEIAKSHGLSTAGTKSDLIERLTDA